MATTRLIPLHTGKGRKFGKAIRNVIGYVSNPKKTHQGELVTGFGCNPETADGEFLLMKREYIARTGRRRGKDDVIAYHLRQSFVPGEIKPIHARATCLCCSHPRGSPTCAFTYYYFGGES